MEQRQSRSIWKFSRLKIRRKVRVGALLRLRKTSDRDQDGEQENARELEARTSKLNHVPTAYCYHRFRLQALLQSARASIVHVQSSDSCSQRQPETSCGMRSCDGMFDVAQLGLLSYSNVCILRPGRDHSDLSARCRARTRHGTAAATALRLGFHR